MALLLLSSVFCLLSPQGQDFSQYKPIRELQFQTERVRPSPDRKYIAAEKGIVSTADWSLNPEPGLLKDFLFTLNPDYAIGITHSDGLWVYSTKTFKTVVMFGIAGNYAAGDISPDGRCVIARTSAANGLVVVNGWDNATSPRETRKCEPLTFAAFVSKERFVTVGQQGGVALWSVNKAEPIKQVTLQKPGSGEAVLSPDRKVIFVLAGDGVHRMSTSELSEIVAAPQGFGTGSHIELSPKRYLAVFGEKSPTEILEPDTLKLVIRFGDKEDPPARCAGFSADDKHFVIGDARVNRIRIVRTADWSIAGDVDIVSAPHQIVVAPDTKWICVSAPPKVYVIGPPEKPRK